MANIIKIRGYWNAQRDKFSGVKNIQVAHFRHFHRFLFGGKLLSSYAILRGATCFGARCHTNLSEPTLENTMPFSEPHEVMYSAIFCGDQIATKSYKPCFSFLYACFVWCSFTNDESISNRLWIITLNSRTPTYAKVQFLQNSYHSISLAAMNNGISDLRRLFSNVIHVCFTDPVTTVQPNPLFRVIHL
jgi:hypothetical protein